MSLNWLSSRLVNDQKNEIEVNLLYSTFKFELIESSSESNQVVPGLRVFLQNLKSVFPEVKRVRKRGGDGNWLTLYRGIAFKPLQPLSKEQLQFKDITKFMPQTYSAIKVCTDTIVFAIDSGCICNGNTVLKTLTFHKTGNWELIVFGKPVNLKILEADNKYIIDEDGISSIFSLVENLNICQGVVHNKNLIISRFHLVENFKSKVNSTPTRTLRSVSCNGIVPFTAKTSTCKTCRVNTFSSTNKENTQCESANTEIQDDEVCRIKHLLKHANPKLVSLFLEQAKNVDCDPRGRRWSKSLIGTCLQLYNRSPHGYEQLLSSNILILPSKSTLILYKNKLKQEPGFDQSMFEWMLQEAKRKDIPEDGMVGGILFDEMAIQSDIQISKSGDVVELVGFTDLNEEGDLCNSLRKGTSDKKLGTHVLQFLFLGITGFRFPFAHFVSDGVQCSELYSNFWKAVQFLWTYGFSVLYTCMDGAVCNRSFMHLCCGDNSDLNCNFVSTSPTTPQSVIMTMDVSHVLKKIRNNIINSGIKSNCTRNLTLENGHVIQWQMFIDCYQWDSQNSLQLHRKLSNEHIFPDNQQKMRNHLAEEVLNSEMLYLMKVYKNYLGEKGAVLDGVIQLLENTSQIVTIFRDMRPVKDNNDTRLATLQNVSEWFLAWERFGHANKYSSKKGTYKVLMSAECHEDIHACLQGFIQLCHCVTKRSKSVHVTPGLINSDVIENIFNQQRATYNGANSNPNALQYRNSINSILIGEKIIPRKSNAGRSMETTPFTVEMKKKEPKNDINNNKPCSTKKL